MPEMLRSGLAEIVFSGAVSVVLGSIYGFAYRLRAFEEDEEEDEYEDGAAAAYDSREPEWQQSTDESLDGVEPQYHHETDINALD